MKQKLFYLVLAGVALSFVLLVFSFLARNTSPELTVVDLGQDVSYARGRVFFYVNDHPDPMAITGKVTFQVVKKEGDTR